MPCYSPVRIPNPNFDPTVGPISDYNKVAYMDVPCWRCVGCRYDNVKDWSLRCMHEAMYHKNNMFLTLTYNDESLPADGSVSVREIQLFMKRFRKRIYRDYGIQGIKFFACGEYGSNGTKRPHYHVLIFGVRFNDLKIHQWNKQKQPVYISKTLDEIWSRKKKCLGFSTVGEVTSSSAAYVAAYNQKKIDQRMRRRRVGPTGQVTYELIPRKDGRVHEFMVCSRGIGLSWICEFANQCLRHGYILSKDKKKQRIPRYYINKMEDFCLVCPHEFEIFRQKRVDSAIEKWCHVDNSPERLEVREFCHKQKLKERCKL